MTAKSHVLTTLNVAIIPLLMNPLMIYQNNIQEYYLFIGGVILGSLFPDIDESNSYIGKCFPLISSSTNFAIGHRTLTHNFFIWIFVLTYGFTTEINFIVGIGFGAIFHIIEDSITNSGAKWALKPFPVNFILLPKKLMFDTNKKFENFIYLPVVTIILLVQMIYILNTTQILENIL